MQTLTYAGGGRTAPLPEPTSGYLVAVQLVPLLTVKVHDAPPHPDVAPTIADQGLRAVLAHYKEELYK